MTEFPVHPAAESDASLICADPRCATLLPSEAEICDECGGTRLDPLSGTHAMLCGWADARPVVFKLSAGRSSIIGRSTPGGPVPDVDLGRLPGSEAVHRRHALIESQAGEWRVVQLGSNPLFVDGHRRVAVATGSGARVRPGEVIEVGGLRLQLLVRI